MASNSEPWVLGLSASHNGAACLLQGDRIVVAIQEERLIGLKRAPLNGRRPSLAVHYCLQEAGIGPSDLDLVVLSAQLPSRSPENDVRSNPFLNVVANGVPLEVISHHAGHAISAFATSGYPDAAVLVVDGMGSPQADLSADEQSAIVEPVSNGWETTSLYSASGTELKALEKHLVKDGAWLDEPPPGSSMKTFGSLGGIFSASAEQIFGDESEAGKVMGLAPYGSPVFSSKEFFEIVEGRFVFRNAVQQRFSQQARWPTLQQEYQDLACSAQVALEQAILHFVERLRELCPSENLVYVGGVALNSVANERIVRESGYRRVYVMPAAEDSGVAIGAAYYGAWKLTGRYTPRPLLRDGFGHTYDAEQVSRAITSTPAIRTVESTDTVSDVVNLLTDGSIVGWFSGPAELGPRALGQRSILCDPRRPDAKERLNSRVKHREAFRPFAPAILLEEVANWFDVEGVDPVSPFMLRVMDFLEDKKDKVPGVVHVDGTGRVQTVTKEANGTYYKLVKRFHEKTGVPILLNTSFNVMGEPIVETPEDALWCLLMTQLDYCVLEDKIVGKKEAFNTFLSLYPYWIIPESAISWSPGRPRSVTLHVQTPWGKQSLAIADPHKVQVIERLAGGLLDGKTTTEELFNKFVSNREPLSESFLIRLFALLRRLRVISFRETPPGPG